MKKPPSKPKKTRKTKWVSRRTFYAQQRAKDAGVEYEDVSLRDIIKRDGPLCYICGRKTLTTRSRRSGLKAELEHVIPISKGGDHLASNLKCACRRCNRLKSFRYTPEQTRALLKTLEKPLP